MTLGLDREAGVVRRRLAELGQFLDLPGSDATLEQEARDLGLAATDPIIRRHVEHLAELALRQGGASVLPDESEVAHYYEAEVEQFTLPARIEFKQIYFGFARHGAQTEAIARAALERLRGQHLTPADVADWGDPFVLPLNPRAATAADLQRAFGPVLAAAIETAPSGAWSEPLRSAYGLHLVWVRERMSPRRLPLDTVRSQIVHRLAHDHSDDLAARRLATLRQTAARQTP